MHAPPTAKSYASAAKTPPNKPTPSTPSAQTTPPQRNPNKPHDPSRLIVVFDPGHHDKPKEDNFTIVNDINRHLQANGAPEHLTVTAVKWNRQGNCVVVTRSDQTAADILPYTNGIANVIIQGATGIVREDKRWYKIEINNVRTGSKDGNGEGVYTSQFIHDRLAYTNPEYRNIADHIVLKPRWVRPESETKRQAFSSVVFAVDSEDVHQAFLKHKSLSVFGELVKTRAWSDRPPLIQCNRCWEYGHRMTRCQAMSARCRLCGAEHTEDHHAGPSPNGDMEVDQEGSNSNPPPPTSCIHCVRAGRQNTTHPSNWTRCPERKLRIGNNLSDKPDQPKQASEWTQVGPKKPRTSKGKAAEAPATAVMQDAATRIVPPTPRAQNEPPWTQIAPDGRKGPLGHSAWTPILPKPTTKHDDPQPRVMAYFRPRLGLEVALRSDIVQDTDLQVLSVSYPDKPSTTIVNLYNDKTRDRDGVIPEGETVETVDWLTMNGFRLLNTPGEPTFLGHQRDASTSVLDLTFANGPATQHLIPSEWAINPDLAYDSDHFAIQWVLFENIDPVDNNSGVKYNIKDTEKKDWIAAFNESLLMNYAPILTIMNERADVTTDDLERAASALTTAINQANEKAAKVRKPSPHAKPWWNEELAQTAALIRNLRNSQLIHLEEHGSRDPTIDAEIKRARNFFKRQVRHAKSTWANEVLEEITSEEVWSVRKWTTGYRNYPMPAISRGSDCPPAVSHQDKCDVLRETLYQEPPPLPEPVQVDLNTRNPDEIPFVDITSNEVREAIISSSAGTAPGPSQINYTMIKWAWSSAPTEITILLRRCLKMGFHPAQWRRAVAVALCKPNKPDYSQPRAYRLITLLECMGKVLEKVVAKRLTYLVGRYSLISGAQFGGRANSSTVDAALTFIHDVHWAWSQSLVTSVLTFDMKGYFDFVNHNRLLAELKNRRIPLEYVKWTASFLSNREAAICIDGVRGETKPVKNGIPQGSPVSPILATFYSAGLLDMFENPDTAIQIPDNLKHDKPTCVSILMYVDDGKLVVSSRSIDTNNRLLAQAYQVVDQWLWKAGLAPDQDKCELMHYTRRKKCGDPATHIELTERDGTVSKVLVTPTVRWLGIHFDRKLQFTEHVKRMTAKAEAAIGCISMLANTVRGMSHKHLRILYKTCVLPIMTYASAVWWTGKACHAKHLRLVQNRALRLICAAFKTTLVNALEVEGSIPPIHLHLDYLNRKAGIRLNKLSVSSPVIQRLPPAWSDAHEPETDSHPGTEHPTQLNKIASLTAPHHERIFPFLLPPWRKTSADYADRFIINAETGPKEEAAAIHLQRFAELRDNPEHIVIYSDGSQRSIKKRFRWVGAAAVGFYGGDEVFHRKIGLGGKAEVYDAELTGMAMGLKAAISKANENPEIRHIHIYADNVSAIGTIHDPKPRQGQLLALSFYNDMHKWLDAHPENQLSIEWCPGHTDIPGNDRADALAKEAISLASSSDPTTTYNLRRAREIVTTSWRRIWKDAGSQPTLYRGPRVADAYNVSRPSVPADPLDAPPPYIGREAPTFGTEQTRGGYQTRPSA
ncbi:hypothetical protein NP233_g9541 [Leucocoprinus birnbaumii]|uniref:Reverse transcriptase n=1 Tax=Leucocoprinus birnbaumii TaxID=56174 RepID=A0AAD5VNQ5_9AGAR|nr:hypothetical protein NP233_g9541 [Leucocoprinus birnbaumii]